MSCRVASKAVSTSLVRATSLIQADTNVIAGRRLRSIPHLRRVEDRHGGPDHVSPPRGSPLRSPRACAGHRPREPARARPPRRDRVERRRGAPSRAEPDGAVCRWPSLASHAIRPRTPESHGFVASYHGGPSASATHRRDRPARPCVYAIPRRHPRTIGDGHGRRVRCGVGRAIRGGARHRTPRTPTGPW